MSAQETTQRPEAPEPEPTERPGAPDDKPKVTPADVAAVGTKEKAAEQAAQVAAATPEAPEDEEPTLEQQVRELSPLDATAKIWIIGKPPEHGGGNKEWAQYTQRPLGFIELQRWYALVTRSIFDAIKEGGSEAFSSLNNMMSGTGNIRARAASMINQDWGDNTQFLAMLFALASYAPDFLLASYRIWLGVKDYDATWFDQTVSQPWDPENDLWGLNRLDIRDMTQRFIDQNYDEVRAFFGEEIMIWIARIQKREEERQARESESRSLKSSKNSAPTEATP